MKTKTMAALLIGCISSPIIFAQKCPDSMHVTQTIAQPVIGWTEKNLLTEYDLEGFAVADPRMDPEGKSDSSNLVPDGGTRDGVTKFTFRGPVGEHEIWMLCYYRNTSIMLKKRIQPSASICVGSMDKRTRKHSAECRAK